MTELIGMFRADQKRERYGFRGRRSRNSYSHLVVVFDVALVLIETSPQRDRAAAIVHGIPGSIPIPLGPIHHIAVKQIRHVIRLGPKASYFEAKVLQTTPLTPDGLDEAFPRRARALWNEQITSAILRRWPPDLKIWYVDRRGREMQLWLNLPRLQFDQITQNVAEAAEIMSVALGSRLKEVNTAKGMVGAGLDLFPDP